MLRLPDCQIKEIQGYKTNLLCLLDYLWQKCTQKLPKNIVMLISFRDWENKIQLNLEQVVQVSPHKSLKEELIIS